MQSLLHTLCILVNEKTPTYSVISINASGKLCIYLWK